MSIYVVPTGNSHVVPLGTSPDSYCRSITANDGRANYLPAKALETILTVVLGLYLRRSPAGDLDTTTCLCVVCVAADFPDSN